MSSMAVCFIGKKVDLALGNPVQLEWNMSALQLEGLSLWPLVKSVLGGPFDLVSLLSIP